MCLCIQRWSTPLIIVIVLFIPSRFTLMRCRYASPMLCMIGCIFSYIFCAVKSSMYCYSACGKFLHHISKLYIRIRRHTHRCGSTLRGNFWFIVNHLLNHAEWSGAVYSWGARARRKRVGETRASFSSVKLVSSHDGAATHGLQYISVTLICPSQLLHAQKILFPCVLWLRICSGTVLLFILRVCVLGLGLGRDDVVARWIRHCSLFQFHLA